MRKRRLIKIFGTARKKQEKKQRYNQAKRRFYKITPQRVLI